MYIGAIGGTPVIHRTGDAEGVLVRRFIDGEQGGSRTMSVSIVDMPAGTVHRLHRHPTGEQLVYVQSGTVEHLTEDSRTRMVAGDFAFIPAGEWHGVGNPTEVPAMTVVMVGLVDGATEIGYEAHPRQNELPE